VFWFARLVAIPLFPLPAVIVQDAAENPDGFQNEITQ
jgi:hypothetical protein